MAAILAIPGAPPIRPPPHRIGLILLDLDSHEIIGPRGQIRLAPIPFAVIERLIRKPGTIITRAQFMDAMYPDPDDEPDSSGDALRRTMTRLRGLLALLGGREVLIVADGGDGSYVLLERRG